MARGYIRVAKSLTARRYPGRYHTATVGNASLAFLHFAKASGRCELREKRSGDAILHVSTLAKRMVGLVQLLPAGVRSPVSGNDRKRSLQLEVKHGFRGQHDLLTLGGCGNARARARAYRGSDGRAFTATQ